MSIAQSGSNGGGVVTGTPMATDNTGRDVGQAVGLGAATAGAVIGSILTWGAASPALIAGDAAAIGGTIANDAVQDQAQAHEQQRQQQGALDAHQKLVAAAAPQPGAQVAPVQVNKNLGPQPQGFSPPPTVQQAPAAMNVAPAADFTGDPNQFTGASDRRVKTAVANGDNAAGDFLELVRSRGIWPQGVKDPKAAP